MKQVFSSMLCKKVVYADGIDNVNMNKMLSLRRKTRFIIEADYSKYDSQQDEAHITFELEVYKMLGLS